MIVPFTATESGQWVFILTYSGPGNLLFWPQDDSRATGKWVPTLANEIGMYSGTKPQSLDAGKYYLNVTASGPWTIQASVS